LSRAKTNLVLLNVDMTSQYVAICSREETRLNTELESTSEEEVEVVLAAALRISESFSGGSAASSD
jgi:hypothetical protein